MLKIPSTDNTVRMWTVDEIFADRKPIFLSVNHCDKIEKFVSKKSFLIEEHEELVQFCAVYGSISSLEVLF